LLLVSVEVKTMSKLSEEDMRNAVAVRDKHRDGDFYYGVVTTGIFCLASCTSRAVKAENLRFFSNIEEAIAAGFRPCKRCKPTEGLRRVDRVVEIARHIEKHADEKLTLMSLAVLAGISSSHLQRTFREAFGISPKAYQDAVRIRRYKQSLQQGDGVTAAILSAGYGSISRVYGEATRNVGMAPKAYRAKGSGEAITYVVRNTVLGLLMMAATDKGVCFVQFGDDEMSLYSLLETEFSKAELLASRAPDAPELDLWMDALAQHVDEGMPRPDLPLDMRGTAFQMKVWQFLLSIQEGDVLSYGEVATQIDKPKAFRAVASSCARNRIALLIPCHRVLRGDGNLGGYRWGIERKQALLDAERQRQSK
jgi:AraC family transcriptional regulator of adaptative response/methylated-DNA-[protein]-cysteine methyltransferase